MPDGFSKGNIPAHAGKTGLKHTLACQYGEHPRARGENLDKHDVMDDLRGTSPRTRGKHSVIITDTGVTRNIPAHAGKT